MRLDNGVISTHDSLDISVSDAIEFYFPQCVQIKVKEDKDGRE